MTLPIIIPFPVRVAVIVIVLEPVSIVPSVMAKLSADILLFNVTLLATPLLIVRLLKVVAPVMVTSLLPVNENVDVFAANVPLFVQLPPSVCEKVPPTNVVALPMVKLPLIVKPDGGVLVLPFETIRLLKVESTIACAPVPL